MQSNVDTIHHRKNAIQLFCEIAWNYAIKSHFVIATPSSVMQQTWMLFSVFMSIHSIPTLSCFFAFALCKCNKDTKAKKKYQMSSTHEKFNWILCNNRKTHSRTNDKWCFINKIMLIHRFDPPFSLPMLLLMLFYLLIQSICYDFIENVVNTMMNEKTFWEVWVGFGRVLMNNYDVWIN